MRANFSYFSVRHAVCQYVLLFWTNFFLFDPLFFSRFTPAFLSFSLCLLKAFTIFLYPPRSTLSSLSFSHSLWPTAALPSPQRPYKKNGNHTKDAMKRCKIFPRITDDALLFSVCASLFIHWYECEDKQRQQLKTMINKYIWELYSNNTSFYLLCNKL